MSPQVGVFKKLLSISPFSQTFSKSDLNLLFLTKHHWEEKRDDIIKKCNKILIGKTRVERNAIYYFYQNLFLLVVLTCWKRNIFQISMKFHLKKRKIIFETLFSPSFDVLHSSPIVYMDHTELIFQDLLLYCTKKVPKNHNQLFHFRHGGETHFLVLAQTLI